MYRGFYEKLERIKGKKIKRYKNEEVTVNDLKRQSSEIILQGDDSKRSFVFHKNF